jgi:ribonuclease P protein component
VPFSTGILLKHSFRLTKNEDISRVRHEGTTYVHATVVLGVLPNRMDINRVAVIAGRSVGKAVQRNFAKRRLRSAYLHFQENLHQGYDLVFVARKPLIAIDYAKFIKALGTILDQAGLMKENVS